jgi:SAM-dependent methyltransferase
MPRKKTDHHVRSDRFKFKIDADAFAYLVLQRGAISVLTSDRPAWERAYQESIFDDYDGLRPYLPAKCECLLDVGSGLGGIDAILSAHYGKPTIMCLDGEDDSPVMVRHAKTFNDMDVARHFLQANGVEDFVPVTPALLEPPRPCDLVLSLGSWCFHYAPDVYLDYVRECCHAETRVVVDVRTAKPEWLRSLTRVFTRQLGVAKTGAKYARHVLSL